VTDIQGPASAAARQRRRGELCRQGARARSLLASAAVVIGLDQLAWLRRLLVLPVRSR